MNWGRIGSWVCFIGAFAAIALAGWNAYRIVEPAVGWRRAEAVPEATRLGFKHDGQGMLVIYIEARLSYEAAGQRLTTEARSDFATMNSPPRKSTRSSWQSCPPFPCTGTPLSRPNVRFALAYDELAGAAVAWPAMPGSFGCLPRLVVEKALEADNGVSDATCG